MWVGDLVPRADRRPFSGCHGDPPWAPRLVASGVEPPEDLFATLSAWMPRNCRWRIRPPWRGRLTGWLVVRSCTWCGTVNRLLIWCPLARTRARRRLSTPRGPSRSGWPTGSGHPPWRTTGGCMSPAVTPGRARRRSVAGSPWRMPPDRAVTIAAGRRTDAGAVASWTAGELAIQSWLAVAPVLGLTFLLPELDVTETHTLRPHAGSAVEELVTHPHVVLTRMSSADAAGVEKLLATSRTFDVMAGWVVHLCRQRVERTDHRSRPAATHRPASAHRAVALEPNPGMSGKRPREPHTSKPQVLGLPTVMSSCPLALCGSQGGSKARALRSPLARIHRLTLSDHFLGSCLVLWIMLCSGEHAYTAGLPSVSTVISAVGPGEAVFVTWRRLDVDHRRTGTSRSGVG
jgi:hypothetical protein